MSRGAVERRLRTGRLFQVRRGVYAVGHPPLTTAGERRAALIACGEQAVLSHRTAADLWDLRQSNPRLTDVTISSRAGRERRDGIRLHRGPLPPTEVTNHRTFPVTTPARTLLDLAAVITPRALERAIDEAERLGLFDEAAIASVLDANRRRPGRGRLAAVLAAHRPGSTRTRSTLEERFLAFCRDRGLPQPQLNVPIGRYSADFLWPEQRLIVETDGRAPTAPRTPSSTTEPATLSSPSPASASSATPSGDSSGSRRPSTASCGPCFRWGEAPPAPRPATHS